MTTTPAATLSMLPIAFTWFKATLDFWRLPQCVQRLWEWLKKVEHGGATTFKIKDWELAEELGIKRSCVQKSLRWAERLGLIRRYRMYGTSHGRVIEIVINLVGPKPKPHRARQAAHAQAGSGKAGPEQQAAVLDAIAAAAEEEEEAEQPIPTAEEEAAQKAAWEEIHAKAAALKIPSGRYKPPGPSMSRALPPIEQQRASQAAELARREAIPPAQRTDLDEKLIPRLAAELAKPGPPPAPSGP